jgi:hypothetical protein
MIEGLIYMNRTVKNLTKQTLTVAVKVNGQMATKAVPAYGEIVIAESEITPDLLIKAQRGKLAIV